MNYTEANQIQTIIGGAQKVVIVQADNPDGDSLGSALALEHILGAQGRQPYLYCGVDMPSYLRYMSGWDRVQAELPKQFDASIIVDASTMTLLERLSSSGQQGRLANKPCVVLDHHMAVENIVPFASVMINDHTRASTGELLYLLAKQLKWDVPLAAQECIMTSILGDTQGLTNQLASAETYRVMAELVDNGVDRPALEEMRREFGKMQPEIFKYKARLIERTEFATAGTIATVIVPQAEINKYSPLYNPAPLVQNDMLQVKDVRVAIVFKQYNDGRVTGAIRCSQNSPVGAELAGHLGGGGHAFASGFKITDGRPVNEIKSECISYAGQLLAKLEEGNSDEAIQYAYSTG